MTRWLAGSTAIVLLLCGAVVAWPGRLEAQRAPTGASAPLAAVDVEPIDVEARPIKSFVRVGGAQRVFGKLEFRGGLVLTSRSSRFGGLSGLEIAADGRRFVAASDESGWGTGEIVYDGSRPRGLAGVRIGGFTALSGRSLERKRDHDAESVVLLDGTLAAGTLLFGFERNHRIGRFPVRDGVVGPPTGYLKLPPEARRMKSNKGFEAVGVIRGGAHKGAVIAFAERFTNEQGHHTGWLWIGGAEPQRLHVTDIGEFDLTDVKSLPDGSLLLLERRFRWLEGVRMRLRRIAAGDVRPGALLAGEVLIEADLSSEIDNMEGLAIHRGAGGETVLTLVSDDNFNSVLQRTLLLQFTLREDGLATAAPAR